MPNMRQVMSLAMIVWVAVVAALPPQPKLSSQVLKAFDYGQESKRAMLESRQSPTKGLPDGLTDIDILEFAISIENLETTFYQEAFTKFPDSSFTALGLGPAEIANLKSIGGTESTHVTTLISAIAGAGAAPAKPCTYDFKFTDATSMLATAGILENLSVSSYLGSASLVKAPGILTVATQIATVEARHQTFLRMMSKFAAIPSAFDTPLGIRSVFTVASAFIKTCPPGANLAINPFPPLTVTPTPQKGKIVGGAQVKLESAASAGAMSCAFVNGGQTGGTAFVPFTNGSCVIPKGLSGITYLHLAKDLPKNGLLTDDITLAGPMVITIS